MQPSCYNREEWFAPPLVVKDGMTNLLNLDGTGVQCYKVKTITTVWAQGCHSQTDKCFGCRWAT
jgi:hypothetical protein